MAQTYDAYTADGTTQTFAVTFPQYSYTGIAVTVNGVATTSFSYDAVAQTVVIASPAITDGDTVILRRVTDLDILYKFAQGAAFTGAHIDADIEQAFNAVMEARDYTGLIGNSLADNLNARGFKITNLGDGLLPTDAINLSQLNKAMATAIRVPEASIALLPNVAGRKNSIFGFDSLGNYAPVYPTTATADLAVQLLASDTNGQGGGIVGQHYDLFYRTNTVGSAINLLKYATLMMYPVQPKEPSLWVSGQVVTNGDVRLYNSVPLIYLGSGYTTGATPTNDWRAIPTLSTGRVTLEQLGFSGVYGADATTQVELFIQLSSLGLCSSLVLGGTRYGLSRNVIFTDPSQIQGVGGIHVVNSQRGASELYDLRPSNSAGYLISFADGTSSTLGYFISGISIIGDRSNNNQGVTFTCSGYTIYTQNVLVRDFGKTGVALDRVNDGTYVDLAILTCGGYVGGHVYYGLDMYPDERDTSGLVNCSSFYRLHIEHCRFAMRLSGFFLTFDSPHIEKGIGFVPANDYTPWINVAAIGRPVTFLNGHFACATWQDTASGIADISNPPDVLDKLPAFIGSTYTAAEINFVNEYESLVRFDSCDFTVNAGTGRFIDLPDVSVMITGNAMTGGSMYRGLPPVRIGNRSIYNNNKSSTAVISGNTSVYASYVNGALARQVAVNGRGTFVGNEAELLSYTGGSVLIAAFEATDTTNSTAIGNTVTGYARSVLGVPGSIVHSSLRIQSNTTSDTLELNSNSVRTSSSALILSSNVYTAVLIALVATAGVGLSLGPNVATGYATLGTPTIPWDNVYLRNNPVIVSDSRYKTDIQSLTEAEKATATALKGLVRKYKLLPEGGFIDTRWHIGMIAQDIVAAFNSNGLDATQYGIVVHASIPAQGATFDETTGEIITPASPAIDRYSVGYDELLCFIISTM